MSRNDPLRSPLKRVRGYGSAHDGTHHFWVQRLTAVALLPLLVWLVVSIVRLTDASHDAFVAWAASPLNSMLLLIALVGARASALSEGRMSSAASAAVTRARYASGIAPR